MAAAGGEARRPEGTGPADARQAPGPGLPGSGRDPAVLSLSAGGGAIRGMPR